MRWINSAFDYAELMDFHNSRIPEIPARVVLDTNVVVGVFVFADPLLVALREALDQGDIIALANDETLAELERVLRYPELRVDEARAVLVAERYRALCTTVGPDQQPGPLMRLPLCRDRDDQKFLVQIGRASCRERVSVLV